MEQTNTLDFPVRLDVAVIDCLDVKALAQFYAQLLGWNVVQCSSDWASIASPEGGCRLSFQKNEGYQPPVWPEEAGKPQQQIHLDFAVHDSKALHQAVEYAFSLGAKKTDAQYAEAETCNADDWVTLLDPQGHPFCFVVW